MWPPHTLRLAPILFLVAISSVGMAGPAALAQTPADARPQAEAPAEAAANAVRAIALEDVPDRAEATRAELDALLPQVAPSRTLERIGSELDRTLPEVDALLAATRETLAAGPDLRTLNESEAALSEMQARLRPWDDELDSQLDALRPALARLDAIAKVWEATRELALRDDAAATTLSLITAVRQQVDDAHAAVLARRNQILAVLDRLVDPNAALAASLQQVQSATSARLTGILRVDRPPL